MRPAKTAVLRLRKVERRDTGVSNLRTTRCQFIDVIRISHNSVFLGVAGTAAEGELPLQTAGLLGQGQDGNCPKDKLMNRVTKFAPIDTRVHAIARTSQTAARGRAPQGPLRCSS